MKRLKKLSFVLIAFVLMISVLSPNLSLLGAKAAAGDLDSKVTFSGTLPLTMVYGSTTNLPTVTDGGNGNASGSYQITLPTGKTGAMLPASSPVSFKAEYLGAYVVKVFDGTGRFYYEHRINVVMKDEPFIDIPFGGADIPTYIQTGKTFKLPTASLSYYDEDGVKHTVPNSTINITANDIIGPRPVEVGANANEFKIAEGNEAQGSYRVRYKAVFGGDGTGNTAGLHEYSKDFLIKAQTVFEDKVAPIVSVSKITGEYSVGTAITLPTATATDNFDENIRINMVVKGPGNEPIYVAETYDEVNADGTKYTFVKNWLDGEDGREAKIHQFDAHDPKTLTFYPQLEGPYSVHYWAVDDSGNGWDTTAADPTALGSALNPNMSEFTVVDKQPPRFFFTAAQEAQIPAYWSTELEDKHGIEVEFPIPLIIDNKDGNNIGYMGMDADDRLMEVGFSIKNPRSNTVYSESNLYKPSSETSDNNIFTNGRNGKFSFKSIAAADRISGTYSVTYTAYDSGKTVATKMFNIVLESAIDDNYGQFKPNIPTVDIAKNIRLDNFGEATLTKPIVSVIDTDPNKKSGKLAATMQYTLNYNGDIQSEANVWTDFSDDLKLISQATTEDDEVNVSGKGKLYVRFDAVSPFGIKADTVVEEVIIINPNDGTLAAFTETNALTLSTEFIQGEEDSLGTFSVELNKVDRFAGVSVIVRQPSTGTADAYKAGNIVNKTTATYYTEFLNNSGNRVADADAIDATKTRVTVEDLSFEPIVSGDYTVTFVCTSVNGSTAIYTYGFYVKANQNPDIIPLANQDVQTEMEQNAPYILPDFTTNVDNDAVVLRKTITGPHFTLNGLEFIPHTTSKDYAIGLAIRVFGSDPTKPTEYFDMAAAGNNGDPWPVSVKISGAPSASVVKPIDIYSVKYDKAEVERLRAEGQDAEADKIENARIYLPIVVGIDNNPIEKVVYEVRRPASSSVSGSVQVRDDDVRNQKYFIPEDDGEYTITVKVYTGSSDPWIKEFHAYAGDIVPPTFEIENEPARVITMQQGAKFSFKRMLYVEDAVSVNSGDITVTKTLYDPNKSPILTSTIAEEEKETTLEKSGTYTVTYIAKDKAGNEFRRDFEIQVTAKSTSTPIPLQTLATVLIISGVLLIAGVIIYFIRYRRVKV